MPLKTKINKTVFSAADCGGYAESDKKTRIFRRTLGNNVTLIAEHVASVRTAAIGFWFSCGSRFEQQGCRGVSHFAEHMLFKGTFSRTAFDIAAAFDSMGGYANAFTEREQVCIYCIVPALYAEGALEILCDMSENSVFPDAEIERERSVIESEITASLDDPEEAASDSVTQTLWQDNPVSSPIAGTLDDVKKLDAVFLRTWYTEFFKKGNLTVCVSGNVNPLAICSRLQKMGTHKPRAAVPGFIQPKWKSGIHFLTADFQQEQFFVLYPLDFPFSITDYYCWAVLNALIGDTMSSRLFQALRERSGYCYTVYSFVSLYADCGYWCAYACAPKKNAVHIVSAIGKELELLLEKGFTSNEVRAAKEHVCGEEIINAEDMEQRMKRLARSWYFDLSHFDVDASLNAVRGLTTEQLNTFLRRLIACENEVLIVYGPKLSRSIQNEITKNCRLRNS